jgi:hypothetical protein
MPLGFKTSVKEGTADLVGAARRRGLKVEPGDVTDSLSSHGDILMMRSCSSMSKENGFFRWNPHLLKML